MSKTILVVDDDKILRSSLADFLTEKSFEVEEASTGREGLEKALVLQPDLIVTDIKMPEMDGLEMLEQLRNDPKGKDLRAVVLTSDEDTESINNALEAGVTVYLSKTAQEPAAVMAQILTAIG